MESNPVQPPAKPNIPPVNQQSASPLSQQQPPPEKAKSKPNFWKIGFIIAIFLLLLILTFLGYQLITAKQKYKPPQEQEVSEKKTEVKKTEPELPTYNNSRFSFSVHYPKGWSVKESFNGDGAVFTSPATRQPSPAVPAYPEAEFRAYGSHLVLPGSNEKGWQTLEEYVVWQREAQQKDWQGFPFNFSSEESYTVNEMKGIKSTGEFSKNVDDFKFMSFIYASPDVVWNVYCETVADKADYYLDMC